MNDTAHKREQVLSELLAGFADLGTGPNPAITGINMDSRRVVKGDLFLALSGQRHHGLDYLGDVVEAGAAAVAWEPAREGRPEPQHATRESIPSVPVEQLYLRCGPIAARFHGNPSADMPVVGVTGTNGKTSTTQFIAGAATSAGRRCGVIGTLGYGLHGALTNGAHTTPDAVETQRLFAGFVKGQADLAVMEVSSHALEQGRVEGVAFDVAAFTNLSHEHLDYHGDMSAYGASKKRLFDWKGLAAAVINMDDPFGREIMAGLHTDIRAIGYSLSREDAQVYCQTLEFDLEGLAMNVTTPWGEVRIRSDLLGRFNASNLLAALGTLGVLGLDADTMSEQLSRVPSVPGRMERFGGDRQPMVVVDYAHTPDALREALSAIKPHCHGDLWVVFGCGGERDREKRALMGGIAESLADRVVLTDDNPRGEDPERIIEDILLGVSQRDAAEVLRDRATAIAHAIGSAAAEDLVLVAGKGHEDYQDTANGRVPFSDRATVADELGRLPEEGA